VENMVFKNLSEEIEFYNRNYLIRKNISEKLQNEKFMFYEPKVFENYDSFDMFAGTMKRDNALKVLGGDGEIFVLRPDITSEIIEKFSKKIDMDKEYKIFYDGKTFKKEKNINDGILNQMGLEWINVKNFERDREIIEIAISILKDYTGKFVIEIGDTEFMKSIMEILETSEKEKREFTAIVKRKNREDLNAWIESKTFINGEFKSLISSILNFHGSYKNINQCLTKYRYKFIDEVLTRIKDIDEMIEKLNLDEDVHYDLSLIPDYGYYEGLIFKGFSKKSFREIVKGGRYSFKKDGAEDNKIFSVGFSIEMDQLIKEE
jgi:ATP phosphoribosyltransferase regulatory subunit